jgi:hypothetical protein
MIVASEPQHTASQQLRLTVKLGRRAFFGYSGMRVLQKAEAVGGPLTGFWLVLTAVGAVRDQSARGRLRSHAFFSFCHPGLTLRAGGWPRAPRGHCIVF